MEEIECFRTLSGSGSGSNDFSQDKHYEYVYSTRKSFEYIPALGRSDWRHFTTNAYQYAGKWLRSCSRGFGDGGDGGDYWEGQWRLVITLYLYILSSLPVST